MSGRTEELERGLLRAVEDLGHLERAGRHHLLGGGKRLRGRLALAAGAGIGCPFEQTLPLALAVELLHNASLVHDDLQDADRQRRGQLAVWAEFDKPTALLLGDALIARAFGAIAEVASPHLGPMTRALAECVTGLARGQCSDQSGAHRLVWTVPAYEELARAKTGLLFALPAVLVSTQVFGGSADVASAAEAFTLLGVAFQIYDDLADIAGAKGRAVGSDLRCERFSAVVLHTRLSLDAAAGPRAHSTALDLAFEGIPIAKRAELILAGPGVDATLEHQSDVLERARDAARSLPVGLAEVLDDVASDVRAATVRLVIGRDAACRWDPFPELQV